MLTGLLKPPGMNGSAKNSMAVERNPARGSPDSEMWRTESIAQKSGCVL